MSENWQHNQATVTSSGQIKLHKTVALIGMMGAGKTAVGRALALSLGVPFRDSDAEIESASNLSVQEIFSAYGEPFFREKEAQVIARLLTEKPCVLSTGGGAFLSPRNQDAIHRFGVSVWLDADLPLLWSRVHHKTTRPLLNTDNPLQTLTDIFNVRVPVYAKADLTAKSNRAYSIDDMVEVVLQELDKRPDVLERS
ncbi:MAG: shikimate kinase [Pseudomonadota bacterium]